MTQEELIKKVCAAMGEDFKESDLWRPTNFYSVLGVLVALDLIKVEDTSKSGEKT